MEPPPTPLFYTMIGLTVTDFSPFFAIIEVTKQQKEQKTGEKIMRNKCVQMSLEGICNDVSKSMEDQKPALIELLETHIDFETIIPASFYNAFYQRYGRSHIYHLESFVRSLVLQKLLGILTRTFAFTPVFPEIPLTGTIYTGTELSLSVPLT